MRWLVAFLACIGIAQAQVITHQIYDDGHVHIPLQFGFPYYGRIFTDSYMFSNGVVGFGSVNNHWCCSGYDLANSRGYQFNFSIMPLQTDLINYGQGRFLTEGTTQYQRYTWENISEYGRPNNLNTFGVEIRPSGFIGMYYNQVNLDRPFTIGRTGDTNLGEYTQYMFQNGLHTNQPFNYLTDTTGNICVSNPLANPACPNYAEAYLAQQCSISSLYSPSCPNYQQAYLEQQCSLNPLYSTSCQGYAQAYFNEQCRLNPLYDRTCTGYAEAYALANIVTTPRATVSAPAVQVSTTGTVSIETPVVSDPVVNEVITRTPTNTTNNTQSNAQTQTSTSPTSVTTQATKQEPKTEKKTETKQVASVKRDEIKNEVQITQPIYEYKAPIILDMAYQKMVKKPIKDNNRAMYHLIMNSQYKHEEMVNEQYRKRD